MLAPFPCVPFDEVDATYYATIRHDLELQGQVIGPYDLQIAAICVRYGFVLVTNNVSEFSRISGLTVQDWRVGSVVLVLNEMVLVLVIDAVGSSRSTSTSTKIPVNYAKQNCNASSRTT